MSKTVFQLTYEKKLFINYKNLKNPKPYDQI